MRKTILMAIGPPWVAAPRWGRIINARGSPRANTGSASNRRMISPIPHGGSSSKIQC